MQRLRHRAKWLDYVDEMLDATSARSAARAVGMHRNTSFRWRHRFLALASHDRPARRRGGVASMRGISHEHVCVLVARDRTGQTRDFVTGRGAVTKRQLHRHVLAVLDPDVLLATDAHAAYRAFARAAGISHAFVNLRAGERVRGAVHVQK